MLLPPVTFPAVDGLAVYPAQPRCRTRPRDDRCADGDADGFAQPTFCSGPRLCRCRRSTCVWWNAERGRIETAHLDAVTMQVAGKSGRGDEGKRPPRRSNWTAILDLVADHWVAAIFTLVGLAALAWLIPRAGEPSRTSTGSIVRPICSPNNSTSIDSARSPQRRCQGILLRAACLAAALRARGHRRCLKAYRARSALEQEVTRWRRSSSPANQPEPVGRRADSSGMSVQPGEACARSLFTRDTHRPCRCS
jgi:hypothetical protein